MRSLPAGATGILGRYLDALSFLSRLVTRPGQSEERFRACLSAFAPAGLTLGLVWAGAALAALTVARAARVPAPLAELLAGWIWLLALLWTTRGLHWDGVADLADACGSGATGDRCARALRGRCCWRRPMRPRDNGCLSCWLRPGAGAALSCWPLRPRRRAAAIWAVWSAGP